VYSGQSKGHTAVSTKITGKFNSMWEIHSLLTTPDPWLRGSTKSWLAWGTSYLGNLADTWADRGLTQVTWSANQGWPRSAGQLRLPLNRWPSQHNESCPVLFSWELFVCTDWGFLHDFSTVVRWMPGCNAKTRHGSHSRSGTAASRKCVPKVA
jgi:hypothetical protein